jgi:zinc dependent phospholipase C
MPGWFIHLEVANKIAQDLPTTTIDAFNGPGPSPQDLATCIQDYPNYYALGAIGPDLFFFLPDFKGVRGNFVAQVAEWVIKWFDIFDKNVITPWEDKFAPISEDQTELVSRLTGGLSDDLAKLSNYATGIVMEAIYDLLSVAYPDWFGLLGCGPGGAFDDTLFFWSDMFHYRRTNEFACDLFQRARDFTYDKSGCTGAVTTKGTIGYRQGVAFALGWMTHVGTDVTGHPFVNEKSGGPFRLHWQRHHLVENHLDAFVCDKRHGTQALYEMVATSALHFWVQFRDDNTPKYNYLLGIDTNDPNLDPNAPTAPLPKYPTGLDSRDYFTRKQIFDVDSHIPPALAYFMLDVMKTTFIDRHTPDNNDSMPTHPIILQAVSQNPDGRPDLTLLHTNYELFYDYLKLMTTGYYNMPRPKPPDLIPDNLNPPIPPGNDDPPSSLDKPWNLLDVVLAIFAYISYIVDWIGYLLTVLPGLIADLSTYPARYVLYLFEWAFYQLWKAFRYLLVVEGFDLPQPDEIDMGLVQLGMASNGPSRYLLTTVVEDVFGGLLGDGANPPPFDDPADTPVYPRDTVVDQQNLLQQFVGKVMGLLGAVSCAELGDPGAIPQPSEYLSPWEYPNLNHAGATVGIELGPTRAGPHPTGALPTDLLDGTFPPGRDDARQAYEAAKTPEETDHLNATKLTKVSKDWSLGDPVNYSLYVIGQLTRDIGDPGLVESFNLDSDRGYGYKCWDFDRMAGYEKQPPTVYAQYLSDFLGASFEDRYAVPCTPPRGFTKYSLCPHPDPQDIEDDNPTLRNVPSIAPVLGNPNYHPGYLRIHYLKRLLGALAAAADDSRITLTWDLMNGATTYNLYRATKDKDGVNGTKIANVNSPYVDGGLANGTTYYYVVTVILPDGTESLPSPQAAATPQINASGAPTGLAAAPGNSQIKLVWQGLAAASSYNLYRSLTDGAGVKGGVITGVKAQVITGVCSFVDTGLTNGNTYYYVVTAVNAAGTESLPSAQAGATPGQPALRYPSCKAMY